MAAGKAVAESRPYEKLVDHLRSVAGDDGDAFDIAASVMDKVATAETADDIFAANEGGPGDIGDYCNTDINVTWITLFKSAERFTQNGQGLGAYGVVDGFTDNGEPFKFSTGATNVVSSLFKARTMGLMRPENPFRCRIVPRETANGTLYTVGRPQS